MSERKGAWIQTYTGKQFWPMDPRPEEIDIRDIAHSLAMQCRFNGHCERFYSVAEHSIHVFRLVTPMLVRVNTSMWGLLHDAAEAYLSDIPRPIKGHMMLYRELEFNLMAVIAERFGLEGEIPECVVEADNQMLATEAKHLMKPPAADWGPLPEPLDEKSHIWCLTSKVAESQFLRTFNQWDRVK